MREQQTHSDHTRASQDLTGIGAAELQRYLQGMDYPASRSQLLAQAKQQDAPQDVLEAIELFPEQQYNSAVQVSQMLDRVHH